MLSILSVESGYFVAICLFVVIFLMPFLSCELRKSGSIVFGYWFVIFLHQIVAFLNAHLFAIGQGGTLGARSDANQGFQHTASELALHGEISYRGLDLSVPLSLGSFLKGGGAFYYEMLGTVYKWFGVSHLLGEQLSILAFAFSCILFLKIMRQLGLERYTALSLICFGALPSVVLHGAVTLRESYEVLFFMLAVYSGVKTFIEKKINIPFACLLFLSALLMGVLHKALLVYSVFLVFLFLVWLPRPISRFGNMKKQHLMAMVLIPLLIFGVVFVSKLPSTSFEIMGRLLGNWDIINPIEGWRGGQALLPGRTTYGVLFDSSSLLMVTFSYLKIVVYYFFAPFPWRVRNSLDIYGVLESISRLILICFSVWHWRNARGEQRRLLGLMLILYFSMSLLWAMGTTNYGTAMRHNMVAWWIIVIMGVPKLMATLKRFWSGIMRRYPSSLARILHD